MKKMLFLLFAFLFVYAAAQDKGKEVLKSVQNKFNSVSDLSADVKQSTGGKTNFTGKLYFKKNDMFRVEYNNSTIVSNGSTTWNYNKKEKKVVINTFDSSNPSALSVNAIINDYPSKSDVQLTTENGKNVLTLTPRNDSGLNFKQVKLWVNDDNLVEKVSVIQQGGNTTTINISNYKLNQNIPDSQFSFTPPAGTKVVDLR